jgi:putative ABC transport system permease protein
MMHSLRMMAANWRLMLVAVLSLGTGLAAAVLGFGVFNALLLRPPGVRAAAELLTVFAATPAEPWGLFSYDEFRYYRDRNQAFSGMAAFPHEITGVALTDGDRHDMVSASYASDNFFDVLGVQPALGTLRPIPGDRSLTVVLTDRFWRRLGGDREIVGRTIWLNRQPARVIGVAPKTFAGMVLVFDPDIWLPLSVHAGLRHAGDPEPADRTTRSLALVARLKPGVSVRQAQSQLTALSAQRSAGGPAADAERRAHATATTIIPASDRADGAPLAWMALLVMGLALLAACSNVTNLLLALATVRRQELLIRTALGATRARLVRQGLGESLVLAAGAGLVGLAAASAGLAVLSSLRPSLGPGFPVVMLDFHPDLRVAGFAALMALVVGIVTGLAPALRASSDAQTGALNHEAGDGGPRSHRIRGLLVVAEVAIATLVLIGVGWCLRTIANLERQDVGFSARELVVADINLLMNGYTPAEAERLHDRARSAVAALPGVESVSIADGLPLGLTGWGRDRIRPAAEPRRDDADAIAYSVVDEAYFTTLGIRVLSGRTFGPVDRPRGTETVVVNQTMARRLWPGQDPVGQWARIDNGNRLVQIVGVVADGKYSDLDEPPTPFFYLALRQHPLSNGVDVIVRTAGDAAAWAPALRDALRAADAKLEFVTFTLDEQRRFALMVPMVTLVTVSGFGLLALGLAAVGLHGTVFYAVSQRRREIGIRMALGALPSDLFRLVLGRTAALAGAGAAAGVGLSLLVLPLVSSLFYGLPLFDPLVVAAVVSTAIAATLAAAYLAARPWMRTSALDLVRRA